jgi:hypothetical protein
MKNYQIPRLLLMLGASIAIFTGCSTDVPEPLIHTPSTGSIFMFDNYQTDSTGDKIDLTETHTTRTILNTNATIEGKSGVVQFQEEGDTASMKYEGNGDVYLLQPAQTFPNEDFPIPDGFDFPTIRVPARWVQFGLGSKNQFTVPEFDTTVFVTIDPIPLPIAVVIDATGNTTYLGTENFIVSGETIATQKALLTVKVNFSAAGTMNGNITTIDTLWFAPKLGMFIKDVARTNAQLPAQFGTSGPMGGRVSVMTGYAVK